MRTIVAVVICGLLAVPAGASTTPNTSPLLRKAARLSGLAPRRPVPATTVNARRYDALLARAVSRDYPRALRRADAQLYALLGLSVRGLNRSAPPSSARYDVVARKLFLRRTPAAARTRVVHELVRALVDQHFGLRRLVGLRARDRDRALAARAIVEGTAALASGRRAAPATGAPLDRFLHLEDSAGLGPGRALAKELRYLGGRAALASALRAFPRTTEQLLHVDKFLERERALPVRLPSRAGAARLGAGETFGELDVRSLLSAFRIPNANEVAAGWGGGRVALYVSADGETTAAVALRWDTPQDAAEWRAAVDLYVAAAFPGVALAAACPPLDRCWSGTAELAAGALGETTVVASGRDARELAAALLVQP